MARGRSAILSRNTSIFDEPEDTKKKLWPSGDIPVKSKIEYILYRYLAEAKKSGLLDFEYEAELVFKNKELTVHPDFTVKVGGKTFYWEHLGELDRGQYYKDWQQRRKDYEANGIVDQLITTDDLGGVRDEIIRKVIDDLTKSTLAPTPMSDFSRHHYVLYPS